MQRVLAGCRPSAVPRLAGSPPPLPPLAGRGAPILPPRRSCSRTVAAHDGKLTGRSTETIPHDSGGGGSYSNRHGGGGGGGSGDGSDGSSGDGHNDEPNPQRLLLLATLKWLAAAALVAAALLAALPAMLSHPAGLKLVLAAVNLASPLALTVHLDSVQLGWQQPLLLSGLRLVERSASSGEGDYSSSDDEEPLPVQTALVQPDSAASSGSSSSGQPSSRLRVLRRKGAAAAAPPAADAEQAAAADGTAAAGGRRRRTLVSVERISTTRTLWQLLRGGGAVDCVVAKPQIDCTLNAAGNPRLLAALQQAKVVPKAHPAPAQQAAGTAAVAALAVPSTTALAGQPAGQSAAGGGGKGGQGGSKEQAASRQPAAGVAAAAAGASKQRRHDDSSDSEAEEPSLPVRSAAGPRGSSADAQSVSPAALLGYMMPAQGLKRSGGQQGPQRAQQEAQPPAQQPGDSGSAAGQPGGAAGGSGSKSWVPESLQVASGAVKVTGEVNTGKLSLCISDGALLVPGEVRELLGKHLHFEVLQGASAIEVAAADEQPAAAAGSTSAAAGSSAAAAAAAASSSKRPPPPAAAKWVRQRPAVLLPWGTGMPQMPVQLRLDGELMQFSLQGWQTTKGFTYLRRPVEARMRFTPALSKYLLTHLHPLLGGTVGMKGATVVEARLIPHDGLLPTSQATVRVEPLSVEIGESPVLRSTVGVLGEVVKKLKLSAGARAELSPLQATLGSDGRLTAERLDVRIKTGLGPWSKGLHLISWGSASLRPPQSLDATLAVPGDALVSLGLPELPEGTGLPLHISGTPSKPEVEVGRASKQLALLVAKQQAAKMGGGKGGAIQFLVDQVQQIGGTPESIGVPLPPPLPPTVR